MTAQPMKPKVPREWPMDDNEYREEEARKREYWAARAKFFKVQEHLDGAPPLDDDYPENVSASHHNPRFVLAMDGATPPGEIDLEESAARASAWLIGGES